VSLRGPNGNRRCGDHGSLGRFDEVYLAPAADGHQQNGSTQYLTFSGRALGTTASLSYTDNPIATGEWDALPVDYGTFGTAGPPSETATTSASVVTSRFDPAVSSPTSDLESGSASPATSLDSFTPITIAPGQTGTVPVTITPSGAPGTKITGTHYLDDTA